MLQWAAQTSCKLKETALQETMQCNCSKTDTSSCKEISDDNNFNDLSRLSQAEDYLKTNKKEKNKHAANCILDCIRRGVATDCLHLLCIQAWGPQNEKDVKLLEQSKGGPQRCSEDWKNLL